MQSTMRSSSSPNDSGPPTPGNNQTVFDLDHQLLSSNRIIQQQPQSQQSPLQPAQQQQQQQQQATLESLFPEFDSSASFVSATDLDWLLTAPHDNPAAAAVPAPELFDEDLEQALASFEPSQLNLINNLNTLDFTQQQFLFHRGAPTSLSHPGPLSAITASSESTYDDGRSESHYNPYSPQGSLVNAANPSHFTPSLFQAFENFSADLAAFGLTDPAIDGSQLNHNLLNPIQTPSVNLDSLMPASTASGHSLSPFEDSGLSSMAGQSPENQLSDDGTAEMEREFGNSTNLINPANYPTVPPQSSTDPRKKYQCPNCPRAFARAFNLKTHMATHDPNRLKPHVCHHPGCGRSFSRKHDLGRHLVSIHKDESGLKMANGVGSSASSTYGVSGHPLPRVNAHANAGRLHQVGSTGATSHQKGSTTPTAPNFLPNLALGSQNANFDALLGSSFIKTEPKPLTIPGLSSIGNNNGTGVGVAAPGVARGWCDACGHGWVGQRRTCKCGGELDSKVKIKT